VGLAPYGIPGSEELASNVAETFAQGYNTIIMENHGTVVVGGDLFEAFRRFETLDFCARLIARANGVGKAYPLNQRQLGFLQAQGEGADPEPAPGRAPLTFQPAVHSSRERQLRKDMVRLIHRAYDQLLFTSTEGTFSARVEHRKGGETNAGDDEVRFLITPYGVDRKYMEVSDLVLISGDKQEAGKTPSRSAELHREIYRHHPHIQSVMIAHPPNITAFAVAHKKFDTTLIPESYVFLREIPLLSFGAQYHEYENVVGMLSREVVMILIENDCIISTGESLLQSFDRLEIAEFTAQAVFMARDIGPLAPISGDQIAELKRRFM
jgi:L-fuculose-phosphate aldolase